MPVSMTTGPQWLSGGAPVLEAPAEQLPPMLEDLAAVLRKYQGPA